VQSSVRFPGLMSWFGVMPVVRSGVTDLFLLDLLPLRVPPSCAFAPVVRAEGDKEDHDLL
jgi:hypothetical protein